MAKQVRETKAGQQISAWIVLNKKGNEVATIHAHHAQSRVTVDVWERGRLTGQGSASGYGYDKLTAAMDGLKVGGITLRGHCADALPFPKGATAFPRDFKAPAGYYLTNWSDKAGGWTSCFRKSGLEGLEVKYRVIQVL